MSTNSKTKTKTAAPSLKTDGIDCTAIKARVDSIDWTNIRTDLDTQGWAVVPKLLTQAEADSIAGLYPQEEGFRSHHGPSRLRARRIQVFPLPAAPSY
jgi:hypothetical protein